MLFDLQNEPVRSNVYVAAGVVALSTFLALIAVIDPVTWQGIAGAAGGALAQFATMAFGIERSRDYAVAPSTHKTETRRLERMVDEIASAEAALGSVHVHVDDLEKFPEEDGLEGPENFREGA